MLFFACNASNSPCARRYLHYQRVFDCDELTKASLTKNDKVLTHGIAIFSLWASLIRRASMTYVALSNIGVTPAPDEEPG